MAEAAALQFDASPPLRVGEPNAIELTTCASERFTRAKAEHFIGSVATANEVEISPEAPEEPKQSLHEAIRRAAEGDPLAKKYVERCVATDVIERSIKVGHVMSITQELDANGQLIQFGQSGRSIQANSLRFASGHPKMRPRTVAETHNLFRIEDAHHMGLLEDHWVLVPSRPPDDMHVGEMAKEGFFVDTMSIAFQATTAEGEGKLLTQSAFVAGKRDREAPRHDAEMVRRLATRLGIDVGEMTATELLDSPWLIPKTLMPDGVIDVVRMADEEMGTFFGQDKPSEGYQAYLEKCKQRESELQSTVEEITEALLNSAPNLHAPIEATQKLHELSEAKLVARAVVDEKIDATVFGHEAATYVEAARYYLEQGNMTRVEEFMQKAFETADSSSCPGAATKSNTGGDGAESEGGGGSRGAAGEKADDRVCDFVSKKCPLCGSKNVKTVSRKVAPGKKVVSGSCGCTKVYFN
jgi:hypothetical protein